MNLDNLDPADPTDAMLLEIQALTQLPAKAEPLKPKALFARELHDDNWEVFVDDDLRDVEGQIQAVHASFSVEESDIPLELQEEADHDEEMQHVLDTSAADAESGRAIPVMHLESDPRRRPPPPACVTTAAGRVMTEQFEIYVPNDSMETLDDNSFIQVLDDKQASRKIMIRGNPHRELRVQFNLSANTRAAVSHFNMRITSLKTGAMRRASIRTWQPRLHSKTGDHGVTFTFEHFGSSLARQYARGERVRNMELSRPPVGLFSLIEYDFPFGEHRYARDPRDGLPGVGSMFIMSPGSFVTVVCPLDSKYIQRVDDVLLELNYSIHGANGTLMRLAIEKSVFAGLLFYDQKQVFLPRVPVTETMHVDVLLHVRVRKTTTDQTLLVAVESAQFTVPYGFEGILRERVVTE